MWLRHREDDGLIRLLHAQLIFEILTEDTREVQVLALYQPPSGSLDFHTFLVLQWPPLKEQGLDTELMIRELS
jgi:hypothetical protein